MNIDYSTYAVEAQGEIQYLNDYVQICIDNYYNHTKFNMCDTLNLYYLKDISKELLSYVYSLDDILIKYISHIRESYIVDDQKDFIFSIRFDEYIYDIIDFIETKIESYEKSDIIDDTIIKFVDIKCIYDSIVNHLSVNPIFNIDDVSDKHECTNEEIVFKLDSILSDSLESIESLHGIYNDGDSALTILKLYIFELRMVIYIIQFIESIQSNE